jgi:hypothetical protein
MRRPQKPAQDENSLLGDLESIRQLLSSTTPTRPDPQKQFADDPADVPMLDDVVDGALEVDESPLGGVEGLDEEVDGPSALADDTIEALLGDQWREAADRIIGGTRAAMSAASARWSDAASRSLHDALHERIDSALNEWLADVTLNHLDDLRARLLVALEAEVARIADRLSRNEREEAGDHGE